jgi:hypothetical protein
MLSSLTIDTRRSKDFRGGGPSCDRAITNVSISYRNRIVYHYVQIEIQCISVLVVIFIDSCLILKHLFFQHSFNTMLVRSKLSLTRPRVTSMVRTRMICTRNTSNSFVAYQVAISFTQAKPAAMERFVGRPLKSK